MFVAVFYEVHGETHRWKRRIDILPSADNLFEYVILNRAANFTVRNTLFFGQGQIHTQQDRGRGIDGHGGGHFVQGYLIKKDPHVINRINGNSHLAHFSHGESVVGVVAGLSWEIEGDTETGLPLFKQIAIAFIGLTCGTKAGILTHGPKPSPIHSGLHPPGEGILSRISKLAIIIKIGHIERCIKTIHLLTGNGGKSGFSLRKLGTNLLNWAAVPLLLLRFDGL